MSPVSDTGILSGFSASAGGRRLYTVTRARNVLSDKRIRRMRMAAY
jgi:hypothetical protein